jgi:hypothetical protein
MYHLGAFSGGLIASGTLRRQRIIPFFRFLILALLFSRGRAY